jgi:hypothetical protein
MRKTSSAFLLALPLLCGCANTADQPDVKNDPGGTNETGAIPNQNETHASGALSGYPAANGDPISGSGDLGPGSAADPENGVNASPLGIPF